MKMQTASRGVETNFQSTAFSMGDPSKLFAILADKIYSDKPRAVVREYASNALDIHLRVGQTRPFEITLPSIFEPTLTVRDFGTGLRPDLVEKLFCTFFASDKTDSNNELGGFGLGSKAGFAYADAFTITSYQAGTKTSYAAFRGDDNIPQISAGSSQPTNEPDGLEVRIPVQRSDFGTFEHRVQDLLRWFPEGSYQVTGTEVPKVQVNIRTPLYIEVAEEAYNYVLMGPIAYQVDWSIIGVNLPRTIVPIFQIGELDLPPSREQLSYDPRTIAKLKERYEEVAATIVPQALRTVRDMHPRQRLAFVENLRRSGLKPLFEAYHVARGHRAKDKAAQEEHRRKTGGLFNFQPKWGDFLLREHERHIVQTPARTYRKNTNWRRRSPTTVNPKFDDEHNLEFRHERDFQDVAYFLMDVDAKAPRIFDRLEVSGITIDRYVVIYDAAAFAELQQLVTDAQFYKLSDFDPPVKTRAKSKVRHHLYGVGSNYGSVCAGELPDEGIYIPYDGKDPDGSASISWYRLSEQPLARDQVIYGLNATARKVVDMTKFVRLDDWLKGQLLPLQKDPNLRRVLSASKFLDEVKKHRLWPMLQHASVRALLPTIAAKLTALEADLKLIEPSVLMTFQSARNWGWVNAPEPKDYHKIIAALDAVEQRKPHLVSLLRLGGSYNNYSNFIPLLQKVMK